MIGIVIAGPTAVGKTDLSIKLAKELGAVIISADSAQVYTGMNIGTAKISETEMEGVPHYMIDILEPTKKYSVGDYQREVDNLLAKFEKENKPVILTGGTGLYLNSITEGLSALPSGDPNLRKELQNLNDEELFSKLLLLDPEAANTIHINNRKRVERALEVCLLTNQKFSNLSKINIKNNNYDFIKVCLKRDRDTLYERINKRVEIMFDNELIEEVKTLYNKYGGDVLRKINIIGYTEIIDYLENKISLEEAKSQIQKNSRRYAKRQLTWFRNDPTYLWFDLDNTLEKDILEKLKSLYLSK